MSVRISLMPLKARFALILFFALYTLGLLSAVAQTAPTDAATPKPLATPFTNEIGYAYTYPSSWDVLDMKPAMPVLRQQIESSATSEAEKQAADCMQVDLMLRHGTPPSMIEVLSLPISCFPMQIDSSSLGSFGIGIASGITRVVDVQNPIYSTYKLGTHDVWIERAEANFKATPDTHFTLDIACTILKKGFMCFMSFSQNPEALKTFESSLVSLEGEPAVAVVPENAFKNAEKPKVVDKPGQK